MSDATPAHPLGEALRELLKETRANAAATKELRAEIAHTNDVLATLGVAANATGSPALAARIKLKAWAGINL